MSSCEREHAYCFTYADSSWDSENNTFSHEPTLQKRSTSYTPINSDTSTCFQITWVVDRTTTQKSLSHVSMDTEGVRTGTMEVQIPYFLVGPQIIESIQSLCTDEVLDHVAITDNK